MRYRILWPTVLRVSFQIADLAIYVQCCFTCMAQIYNNATKAPLKVLSVRVHGLSAKPPHDLNQPPASRTCQFLAGMSFSALVHHQCGLATAPNRRFGNGVTFSSLPTGTNPTSLFPGLCKQGDPIMQLHGTRCFCGVMPAGVENAIELIFSEHLAYQSQFLVAQ
jgi:hypothetical protein